MRPPATSLLLLAMGGAIAGCSPAQSRARVCGAPATCAAVCVAERCLPEAALPVASSGVRVRLSPRDLVVLASSGRQRGDAVAVGEATGEILVLLRFAASYRDDAEIVRAFVVLDPLAGAPPAAGSTTLEVAAILEPWASSTATWGRRPRLAVPELAAIAGPGEGRRVRLDVTELVRRWSKHRADDHGIAIFANTASRPARFFSTGLAHANGPELEVYLR